MSVFSFCPRAHRFAVDGRALAGVPAGPLATRAEDGVLLEEYRTCAVQPNSAVLASWTELKAGETGPWGRLLFSVSRERV